MNVIVPVRTSQSSPLTRPTASGRRRARSARRGRRRRARKRYATIPGPEAGRAAPRAAVSPGGSDEIEEQAVRAGDARGKLAEKREARVHVATLPVLREQQRPLERLFALVRRREDRGVA